MIAFIKRRWFWFQVAMGGRKAPPPLTATIIARASLDLLEMNMASGMYSPPNMIVVSLRYLRTEWVIHHYPPLSHLQMPAETNRGYRERDLPDRVSWQTHKV